MGPVRRRGPGRPPAGTPVPEPAQVLERGLEAFAELGYEAVSVRQLTERLGMGHTFIHDRFGSKMAFWTAVVDHAVDRVAQQVWQALDAVAGDEQGDDVARLIAAIQAFHRASARHPHLGRLVDYEAARESPRLTYLYEAIGPLNDAARPLFDRLVREGQLRDMPWYLFHFAVTKPLAMYSQVPLARLFGRPEDADDHALLSDLVLNGLLNPARGTQAGACSRA
jgi:TetR/AcrR family transcriptional regulator